MVTSTYNIDKFQSFVSRPLRKLKLPTPRIVSVRKSGLSSKGIPYLCHANVTNMVRRYGGKRVYGHCIYKVEGEVIAYMTLFHSIWLTPENKFVCITNGNYDDATENVNEIQFIVRGIDDCKSNLIPIYHDFFFCPTGYALIDAYTNTTLVPMPKHNETSLIKPFKTIDLTDSVLYENFLDY